MQRNAYDNGRPPLAVASVGEIGIRPLIYKMAHGMYQFLAGVCS